MRIVIIGGSGLVGSMLVAKLRAGGHDAIAASPGSGVNTLTGEGLADVLEGAGVVVDVSNAPSSDAAAVMTFFTTSTRNLLEREAAAGIGHHVVLSIVGTDRLPDSGYFRAKLAQERLIKESSIPFSIVRATQFFEFVATIGESFTVGEAVRVPPALIQPIAADDVASALATVATDTPVNGTIDIAGPEAFSMEELFRTGLRARNDARDVVVDAQARYFGAKLSERTLVPSGDARLGAMRYAEWLTRPSPAPWRKTPGDATGKRRRGS